MSHEIETSTTENITEKWVNWEDIAEHLSVSTDTVRTWIKNWKLRSEYPQNCIQRSLKIE